MLAEKIKDRIRLLEIVDSFGELGASFERIRKEWWACTKGGALDLRTFHRYRKDIEEIFGVIIECRRAGSSSTYYISKKGTRPGDWLRLTCISAFLMGNMLTVTTGFSTCWPLSSRRTRYSDVKLIQRNMISSLV